MKNILIACLSAYPSLNVREITKYSYQLIPEAKKVKKLCREGIVSVDNDHLIVEGYTTNEPAAKCLMISLANQCTALDEIIILCTETVRHGLFNSDDATDANFRKLSEGITIDQYYRNMVESFSKNFGGLYTEHGVRINAYPIDDFPDDAMTTSVSFQIADYIASLKDEVILHLDFNGGFRFFASMFLSIMNLLNISKETKAKIGKVFSTNYQRNARYNPVELHTVLFETPRLADAIGECIRYGRVEGLKQYFKNLDDNSISILNKIDAFIEKLQLCATDYILDEKRDIYEKLKGYSENTSEKGGKTPSEIMFRFVMRDILETYNDLLALDLPYMIKWCVNHGFMQQAITFCSEDSPWYIVNAGIIKRTPAGDLAYQNAVDKDTEKKYYRFAEEKYKKDFLWINYLQHNMSDNSMVNNKHEKPDPFSIARNRKELISSLNDTDLRRLWQRYQEMKDLRNNINHASSNTEYTYEKVREMLLKFADLLILCKR